MKTRIISFNIRCCDDPDGYLISERAPRLKKVLEELDADIIGLQEYSELWEEYLPSMLGEKYEFFNKYRAVDSLESTPLLWNKEKFECLKKGYFWLSDTPEVESRGWDESIWNCHRICTYAVLKMKETGECLTVINTHFGFGDKGQKDSADLIWKYSMKISEYPTFIIGDFNMTPASVGYAEMVKHFRDVNMLTIQDMRITYHGYDPSKVADQHIDYCFIDQNIHPVFMKVIDDTVDGKFPSDHYGLYMELEF